MKVFVFGNPDVPCDALPLRVIPELCKTFPDIEFVAKDPNEEWEIDNGVQIKPSIFIIDTVVGIKEIKVFLNLDKFTSAPKVSMHDFDALTNLRFLQKLGKVGEVTVIGVPAEFDDERKVVDELIETCKGQFPIK